MNANTKQRAGEGRLRRAALAAAFAVAVGSGCKGPGPEASVQTAAEQAAKGDHAAATISLKTVISQGQDTAQVRWLLGKSLLATHQPGLATAELKKALDMGHAPDDVVPLLARAYLMSGRPEMLTRDVSKLPPLQSPRARASFLALQAEAWGALSDVAKLEQNLQAALALDPNEPNALRTQLRLRASRGDLVGAKTALEAALRTHPGDMPLLALLGEFQLVEGNYAAAAETFKAVLARDKSNVTAHVQLITLALANKKPEEARKQHAAMREALAQHALTIYMDAQIAFETGEVVKARDLALALLRASPENAPALHLAGIAEASLGSLVTAQSHLTKALQIESNDPVLRRNLAMVYLRLGQPRTTLAVLKPLLELERPDAQSLSMAGQAALQGGDSEGAEQYFSRALARSPDDLKLKLMSAQAALLRPGTSDQALAQLRDLSQQDPSVDVDKALAGAHLSKRQWPEALAALDRALGKSPNDAALHELKGRILAAKGDRPAARTSLEKALSLDANNLSTSVALAQIELSEGKPQEAIARMRKAVEANPRNHFAAMALADLLGRHGATLDERSAILGDSIKASPTEAEPRIALVEMLLEARKNREALSAAEEANSALPGQATLLDILGRAQRANGAVERAAATFKKAATVAPKSPIPQTRLADLYLSMGDNKSAEVHLRKAAELAPDHGAIQTKLVQFLMNAKRPKDALAFAKDLQLRLPKLANGHLLEGSLLEAGGDVPGAVKAYRAALERQPNRPDVALNLHKALSRMGRLDDADRFAAQWLAKVPGDADFAYQVAKLDIVRGRFDAAEKRLLELVARHPNNVPTLNNLAWLLMNGKKPGALEYAKRASELAPKSAAVLDTYAAALAQGGQVNPALDVQRRAAELEPTNHNIRFNLAKLAIQAGQPALARSELQHLAQLGGAFAHQNDVAKLQASLGTK